MINPRRKRSLLEAEGSDLMVSTGDMCGAVTQKPKSCKGNATPYDKWMPKDHRRGASSIFSESERWKRPCLQTAHMDHMILREDRVGSHGRWKRPCLQTAHMTI
jgi:hypothetical protein